MDESGGSSISKLNGDWRFKRQENFDKFLSESGIGWMKRKVATATRPNMKIEHDDKHYYIKLKTTLVTKIWDFNIGKSFEEVSEMNKQAVVVSTRVEDDKLVMEFTPKKEREGKLVRQTTHIENGELVLTLTVGDVTAQRFFERAA